MQSVSITDEESDEDENNSSKEQQKDNSGFGDCDAGRRSTSLTFVVFFTVGGGEGQGRGWTEQEVLETGINKGTVRNFSYTG